jgi:hypothetical protein
LQVKTKIRNYYRFYWDWWGWTFRRDVLIIFQFEFEIELFLTPQKNMFRGRFWRSSLHMIKIDELLNRWALFLYFWRFGMDDKIFSDTWFGFNQKIKRWRSSIAKTSIGQLREHLLQKLPRSIKKSYTITQNKINLLTGK